MRLRQRRNAVQSWKKSPHPRRTRLIFAAVRCVPTEQNSAMSSERNPGRGPYLAASDNFYFLLQGHRIAISAGPSSTHAHFFDAFWDIAHGCMHRHSPIFFCPTSKMSHTGGGRDACSNTFNISFWTFGITYHSTRRDRCPCWLWRLVRPFCPLG
jgi:hypothetical protein